MLLGARRGASAALAGQHLQGAASDLGIARRAHGNLEHWARQGVLLLNNALTVEDGPRRIAPETGWEAITDAAVAAVAAREEPSVFMLWGSHARNKAARVPGSGTGRHLVLTAPHPSPLSAHSGFFGCRHFSQANAFLDGRLDLRTAGAVKLGGITARLVLGTARYDLRADQTKTVRVKVPAGLVRIARRGKIAASVRTLTGADGTAVERTARITLTRP